MVSSLCSSRVRGMCFRLQRLELYLYLLVLLLQLGSKTFREVVEYYYTEFKRRSDFTTIKEALRERERHEYEQAMTEGAVTVSRVVHAD